MHARNSLGLGCQLASLGHWKFPSFNMLTTFGLILLRPQSLKLDSIIKKKKV